MDYTFEIIYKDGRSVSMMYAKYPLDELFVALKNPLVVRYTIGSKCMDGMWYNKTYECNRLLNEITLLRKWSNFNAFL
jgi:hypothetical protein